MISIQVFDVAAQAKTWMNIWQDIRGYSSIADIVYKDEMRAFVCRLSLHQERYIVKRYLKTDTWMECIKHVLRQDKVSRNIRHAHRLITHGIPTFKVIAAIHDQTHQYLVTSYIPGLTAHRIFSVASSPSSWILPAQALVQTFFMLFQANLYYRDWNFNNLIYHDNRMYLIDLDSLLTTTSTDKLYWYRRAKERFFNNWKTPGYLNPKAQPYFEALFTQQEEHDIVLKI